MGNQPAFRLNRQALIAALISAAFPIVSHAAAGRVEFSMGNVTALSADGLERPLARGGEINTGDTIRTSDGRTQVKFTDGGYISLQPNTQFKVDDYAYEGKTDGSEKGFFKLVKGSLRAITGAIGHTNKTAYRINTPVATIGIRGTELTGEYNEDGDNKKLTVHVSHGSVYLENESGSLLLFQGQSGVVTGEGNTPGYSEDGPIVGAAGPEGGNPQEGDKEQQQQQALIGTFTVAEQYNDQGVPESVNDPLLGVIAGYAAANAEGYYELDYNGSITGVPNAASGGGHVAKISSGAIWANFGEYKVTGYISVDSTYSGSSGYYAYFYPSGNITGTGFNMSGTGGGSMCSGSCTFNAAGLFSGPTAQNAGMGYTINGLFSGGTIQGTAGFHAPSVPAPYSSSCCGPC